MTRRNHQNNDLYLDDDGIDPSRSSNGMSRRAALGLGAVAGAVVGGSATYGAQAAGLIGTDTEPGALGAVGFASLANWVNTRGEHYYIAHRGSGDVFPEHTMEAYRAAQQWGAQCLEVSVGRTSDDVLVCMHDADFDRMTTAKGELSELPSTVLRNVGVRQPRLGPAWLKEPLPAVPLLEEVLQAFGGHVVLCIEAKDNQAYPEMVKMIRRYGLEDSVILKFFYDSPRIEEAKAEGFPVFVYIGRTTDLTPKVIDPIVARLDPTRDYLVVPAFAADTVTYVDDAIIEHCVASRVPVWVYPLHRRIDAQHFFELGVAGAICSSYGYVSTRQPTATRDTWRFKAIASGEVTKDPISDDYALSWSGDNELTLKARSRQHFVTLGQLCPLSNSTGTYHLTFEARWTTMPADKASNLTLAFGHGDDTYYEHRSGLSGGYHALMRPDGRLELYKHQKGTPTGLQLASIKTEVPAIGEWMKFRLDVDPESITWSRLDSPGKVTVTDDSLRGGYLHVGRSASDGVLSLRNFIVT